MIEHLLMLHNAFRRDWFFGSSTRMREPCFLQNFHDIWISSNFVAFFFSRGQVGANKAKCCLVQCHTDRYWSLSTITPEKRLGGLRVQGGSLWNLTFFFYICISNLSIIFRTVKWIKYPRLTNVSSTSLLKRRLKYMDQNFKRILDIANLSRCAWIWLVELIKLETKQLELTLWLLVLNLFMIF